MGAGGGGQAHNPPLFALIRECTSSWGPWHVDGTMTEPREGIVFVLVEQFSWGGGSLPLQRAGLRLPHATASWTYLLRLNE
jgi:hypothetical protein